MSRNSIILTGLAGVVGATLLIALCLFIMVSGYIPVLFNQTLYIWGLFLFLLFFSVVEIPVMILGMRRISDSVNPKAKYIALITNTGFTFFAGVYAAPFILLTGQSNLTLVAGTLLGLLCLVRFIVAVIFLPNDVK